MKKALLLLPVFALTACDKPKYDLTLSCGDGAKGQYLIEAKIYNTKADLAITRLSKEIRYKRQQSLADHTWLYNQIPNIDDTIKLSLPATKALSAYEEPGHVKLYMRHDSLTGGLSFTLEHASDNDLTDRYGGKVPNGEFLVGSPCELVIDRKSEKYDNIPPEKLKEIKACAAYLQDQNTTDTVAPLTTAFVVYDEDSDREMFISHEQMNAITNGVEFHHYSLYNIKHYPQDALHACEVADRLRAYIKEHIDTAGQPIYVVDNMHCGTPDTTDTTRIEIYHRYAKVYYKTEMYNETYRLERSKWTFGTEPTKTFEDDGKSLLVHTDENKTKIGFMFMDQKCFFDETEEDNPSQRKQTKTENPEIINKIFDF